MEEEQKAQSNPQISESNHPVSRKDRTKDSPKNGKKKKTLVIIVILLIIAGLIGGGYYVLREPSFENGDDAESSLTTPETSQPTSAPTPTPGSVERDEISIEILNGTGIAGEASALRDKLASIGYKEIEIGNAESTDYITTQVTYSGDVDEQIVEEIDTELEETFAKIESDSDSSTDFDVEIIIGYKIGYTPAPTEAATPTPEASPTPETTGTPAPTGTEAPTSTP